ncbi:HNH endonuclease signature motif containing protein [Brachybacterium sp.]|uniref:HNH endonuclease signature motif containing protein n=1 Tax=Brachybacterium sp. TaxID=1891286 RepID=UPI002ED24C73
MTATMPRSPVAPVADAPPVRRVRARSALTESTLITRGRLEPGSADAAAITRMMEVQRKESRRHARHLLDLVPFWIDHEDPDLADDREERSVAIAIALRTTTALASYRIRDAHIAFDEMPQTFDRLAAGDMPSHWHQKMLKAVRDLTPFQRSQADGYIASWDLSSIPADRFQDELRQLVSWFERVEPRHCPEHSRDVAIESSGRDDGIACLRVTGPIPEILALARRIDASATAVQAEQRRALEAGAPIPFDLEGDVARDGSAMTLAALRYAIIHRTLLDTAGVEVPAPRHRVNVVVPVLTLMGLDDTPATYGGVTPLPAAMARALAESEPVWHRVFTEPITGEFLPLPAQRYRPTPEMIEHLRLIAPRCAVPGCTKGTTDDAENDHIEEFDHAHPARGGPTSIDNLHRLHWGHHDLKTERRIDPVRDPDGSTTWMVGSPPLVTTRVPPRGDLATPRLATAMMESWEHHRWITAMEEMQRNGEDERIHREWGPIDTGADKEWLDEDAARRARWDTDPPF